MCAQSKSALQCWSEERESKKEGSGGLGGSKRRGRQGEEMVKGEVQWQREKERASQKKEKVVLVGREGYREKKTSLRHPFVSPGTFLCTRNDCTQSGSGFGMEGEVSF